ncbi:hypothetical protein WR25_09924 [Diploscapter pachys]|uniref:Uncharacterized protein n=1 Tax=Diploscapter pachys TaxID=2018661 RepID=A0A2A2J1R3_9BILA|nr:hypothetical protein WR25_09924 [Diploscapter pachys]
MVEPEVPVAMPNRQFRRMPLRGCHNFCQPYCTPACMDKFPLILMKAPTESSTTTSIPEVKICPSDDKKTNATIQASRKGSQNDSSEEEGNNTKHTAGMGKYIKTLKSMGASKKSEGEDNTDDEKAKKDKQASKTWLHEEPNGTGQRLQQGHIGNCKWKEEDKFGWFGQLIFCNGFQSSNCSNLSKKLKRNELVNRLARKRCGNLQEASALVQLWIVHLPLVIKHVYGRQSIVQFRDDYDNPFKVYADLLDLLDRKQHGLVPALDVERAAQGDSFEIAKFMIGLLTDLRTQMGDSVERIIQAEDAAGKLAPVFSAIESMCEGDAWWSGLGSGRSLPPQPDSPLQPVASSPTRSDDSFSASAAISHYFTPSEKSTRRPFLAKKPSLADLAIGISPKSKQQQAESQLRLRENEVDALQVELEQLRNANAKYEAQKREYNKLLEEKRDEKSRREKTENELENAQIELNKTRERAMELERKQCELLKEMKLKDAERQRYEQAVTRIEEEKQRKDEEICQLNRKYRDQCDFYLAKEQECNTLQNKLDSLSKLFRENELLLKEQLADSQMKIEQMKKQMEAQIEEYLRESSENTGIIGALGRQIEDKQTIIDKLQDEQRKAKEELQIATAKHRGEMSEMETRINELTAAIREKTGEIEQLMKRVEELERDRDEDVEEMKALRKKAEEVPKQQDNRRKTTYKIDEGLRKIVYSSFDLYDDATDIDSSSMDTFRQLPPSDTVSIATTLLQSASSQTSLLSTDTVSVASAAEAAVTPATPRPAAVRLEFSPPKSLSQSLAASQRSCTLPMPTPFSRPPSTSSLLPPRPASANHWFTEKKEKPLPNMNVDRERLEELKNRNKKIPPALRSSYAVELCNTISPSSDENNVKQLNAAIPRQPLKPLHEQ